MYMWGGEGSAQLDGTCNSWLANFPSRRVLLETFRNGLIKLWHTAAGGCLGDCVWFLLSLYISLSKSLQSQPYSYDDGTHVTGSERMNESAFMVVLAHPRTHNANDRRCRPACAMVTLHTRCSGKRLR